MVLNTTSVPLLFSMHLDDPGDELSKVNARIIIGYSKWCLYSVIRMM